MEPEVDLHSLRIVRAIAEHGTISAAARALGYSQPAISQHLRRAEARIGAPLVLRAGRGVRLTEPGLVLARHALAITSAIDAAGGELAEIVGHRSGTVRIAGFPTASSTIVPRVLAALRATRPGIRAGYVEAEPPEALGMLRDGGVDLAITFRYPGDRDDPHRGDDRALEVRALFTEPVVIALPAAHPLAGGDAVALAELADETWIAGCPLCRGHLLAACEAVGMEPRIGLETDNALAVLHLVASGLGVALLPRLALATAPVPDGTVIRPTTPSSDRGIGLVALSGAGRVPAIAAAIDAISSIDGADWGLARATSLP